MASKYAMMNKANHYAGIVANAKSTCNSAAQALITPHSQVESSWQGESGRAMADALENARAEILRISARLESLEGQMRAHAQAIFDGWPEEKPKEDEKA